MTKNPPAAAAAALAAAIAGTAEVAMLHPSRIARSPTNPRKTFNETSLIELGASMKTDGQVQAIVVRPITVDALLLFEHRAMRVEYVIRLLVAAGHVSQQKVDEAFALAKDFNRPAGVPGKAE
jgi:hypothetical protein